MPLTSFVAFALISGMVSNLLPFKGLLSMGNKKKSHGARSGEERGVGKNSDGMFGQKLTISEG